MDVGECFLGKMAEIGQKFPRIIIESEGAHITIFFADHLPSRETQVMQTLDIMFFKCFTNTIGVDIGIATGDVELFDPLQGLLIDDTDPF